MIDDESGTDRKDNNEATNKGPNIHESSSTILPHGKIPVKLNSCPDYLRSGPQD